MYDYAIIGGGITGVTFGRMLQQRGIDNFIILEAEEKPGGLCRTENVDGHIFDTGGGHFLHSKYPEVLDWLFEHIPKKKFNEYEANILIDIEGHDINFPIELNLWQLPIDKQVEYLHSYITAPGGGKCTNFKDWIRKELGDKIADNYMIPYNEKLWCMDISRLNTEWLGKIPKTNVKLILKTIIEKNANFTTDVVSHRKFLYPKKGGFQTIFEAIYKHVEGKVRCNYIASTLECDPDSWIINGELRAKKVINTIPWKLLNIISIDGFTLIPAIKKLEYLSSVISLEERPYDHDAHWKYIPNPYIDHHREFYIHNFAPHSKKGGVITDINKKRWLERNCREKNMPLSYYINDYSYPIPTVDYKEHIAYILEFAGANGLYGLGRWGKHRYFNIDHCIKDCMEFFNNKKGVEL